MGVGTAPSMEVQAFQSALRECWGELSEPITQDVILHWFFARQLVRYQGPSGRWVTKKKNDLTNMIKSAEDAIQPSIIKNDSQVIESHGYVDAQGVDVEPYVILRIYAATEENSLRPWSRTHA